MNWDFTVCTCLGTKRLSSSWCQMKDPCNWRPMWIWSGSCWDSVCNPYYPSAHLSCPACRISQNQGIFKKEKQSTSHPSTMKWYGLVIVVNVLGAVNKPKGMVQNRHTKLFYLKQTKQWCLLAIGIHQYANVMSSKTINYTGWMAFLIWLYCGHYRLCIGNKLVERLQIHYEVTFTTFPGDNKG